KICDLRCGNERSHPSYFIQRVSPDLAREDRSGALGGGAGRGDVVRPVGRYGHRGADLRERRFLREGAEDAAAPAGGPGVRLLGRGVRVCDGVELQLAPEAL